MKLDLDYIRSILEEIENQSDGISEIQFEVSESSFYEDKRKGYHYRILIDAKFVDGTVRDISTLKENAECIRYRGLHKLGHEALEAMRNNTLWNKIKSNLKDASIENLKQIPMLAIGALITSNP